jgi:hypothetical protein
MSPPKYRQAPKYCRRSSAQFSLNVGLGGSWAMVSLYRSLWEGSHNFPSGAGSLFEMMKDSEARARLSSRRNTGELPEPDTQAT